MSDQRVSAVRPRMRHRTGITPVIAMMLLTILTVGLAGGLWAWYSQFQEDIERDTDLETRTDLQIQDISCSAVNDRATFTIRNIGTADVDASRVNIFVYMPDGSLNNTLTQTVDWSGTGFERVDGIGVEVVSMDLDDGVFYSFELQLPGIGKSFRAGCIAQ